MEEPCAGADQMPKLRCDRMEVQAGDMQMRALRPRMVSSRERAQARHMPRMQEQVLERRLQERGVTDAVFRILRYHAPQVDPEEVQFGPGMP